MTENMDVIKCFSGAGKVLFALKSGKDMSKLELKTRTGLSMTTVISAVDELVKRGLVSFESVKGARGGKMRSVINLRPDKRVYGISYKSGVLTAVAADLGGEARERASQEPPDGASPLGCVYALVNALKRKAPPPIAIALSLNCDGKEDVLRGLAERYGVPTLSLTNTEGAAHLALWQGAPMPIAALGVGARVKCAFVDYAGRRVAEVGALPSPALITGEGSYASALSSSAVEETLRTSRYHGKYCIERGRITEVRDLADYSAALALTLSSLVKAVEHFLSPSRVILFGEYLTEAFCARVQEVVGKVVYTRPEKEDFARGAAICALKECVFS